MQIRVHTIPILTNSMSLYAKEKLRKPRKINSGSGGIIFFYSGVLLFPFIRVMLSMLRNDIVAIKFTRIIAKQNVNNAYLRINWTQFMHTYCFINEGNLLVSSHSFLNLIIMILFNILCHDI